jgi:Icc-related predicted phosphoesterase
MKIDLLSDLHLDFWFRASSDYPEQKIKSVFDDKLSYSEDHEVLIIAGDISHYNSQISILEKIAEIYNYKKIFCVLGNHDLYLINDSVSKKHNNSSIQRQSDWYSYKSDVVQFLDGDVIEYNGVKFGGCMSWYDGTYNAPTGYDYTDPVRFWKVTMNDANYIKGYQDFYDIWVQEKSKIEKILDADVVITHVCPLSNRIAFEDKYMYDKASMFYAFNGEEFIEKTRAKYWVFGHSHWTHEFEVYGTKCIINALGYPGEKNKITLQTIEIIN